jgi:hypothetical protein
MTESSDGLVINVCLLRLSNKVIFYCHCHGPFCHCAHLSGGRKLVWGSHFGSVVTQQHDGPQDILIITFCEVVTS